MKSRFEVCRADLMPVGLIEGLEGRFEVWRVDLRHGEANLKLRGLI